MHEPDSSGTNGGTGGTQWSPGEPQLAVAVEWPSVDDVQVEVYSDEGDPRLAATIEAVSPSNKDRPKTRQAFAAKCVEHLCRGCGVDGRRCSSLNPAHELLQIERLVRSAVGRGNAGCTSCGVRAVSYQSIGREAEGQLRAWKTESVLGQPLPTVPLWLMGETSVPLDLEASHTAACVDLRIRQAG